MKKIFILLILFAFLSSCAKKEQLNYADIVFNPQNSYSRELKAKYSAELLNIVNKFSEYGIKVQQSGIGFTKGETCKDCKYKEGEFWLFITVEYGNLAIEENMSLKVRALMVAENISKDVLFALKTVDLSRLKSDKNFKGILVSGIWGTYKNIKERVKTENFETVDIYISKESFFDYVDGNISLEKILEYAKGYAKKADEKDTNVEKVF